MAGSVLVDRWWADAHHPTTSEVEDATATAGASAEASAEASQTDVAGNTRVGVHHDADADKVANEVAAKVCDEVADKVADEVADEVAAGADARAAAAAAGTPASATPGATPGATTARAPTASSAVMSARRAFVLVALTLGVLGALRAPAMVHAGEGMRPGATRDLVLGVARPLARLSDRWALDRPGIRLSAVFGHHDADAPSELERAADVAVEPPPPIGPTGPATAAGSPLAAGPTGGAGTRPARPIPPPRRVPTRADPLRVLVTGDSLTEALGPTIANEAPPTVHADTDTRFGTGLVRPDFFDWAGHAHDQIARRDPEAVVVIMGGNDGQGITMPDGRILAAGSPAWVDEYRRRATVVLRVWADGASRSVYWLSLPPARSAVLNGYFQQLNGAAAAATRQVPGARFIDLAPELSAGGRYSDYLRNPAGHTVLARTRDGVHLTLDGARIAAGPVLAALEGDYRLGAG
jgi:hypothetical protein